METENILASVQEFLADLPVTDMDPTSRSLYEADPNGWVDTRRRQIRKALLSQDFELVDSLREDIAHILGWQKAQNAIVGILQDLYEDEVEDNLPNDGKRQSETD